MAANDSSNPQNDSTIAVSDHPSDAVVVLDSRGDTQHSDVAALEKDIALAAFRPLVTYTRAQILHLSKSPLVCPPEGMPQLRDWFGLENEQNLTRKEPDISSPPSSNRERRFRRDADDAEASGRAGFRSTLSQPSQMGNFKHQSLRTTDRDRDRDSDRDARDREGHERLRNLSDKYDRDRLGNNARKERDTAPHLMTGGSARLGSQAQGAATSSRRAEGRDSGKRKPGETNDDWRRGTDGQRLARDDHTGRRDRDDRERPRSRARDSSRPRRDPTPPRRERDRDRDRNRDREDRRDRGTTRDGELRDWERVDRRDRGGARETDLRDWDRADRDSAEQEDPRRWRDDGKREERLAARRTVVDRDRDWDDKSRTTAEDGRTKRNPPRTKRGNGDDREERTDRERERDKEKEPAWMDNYEPPTPGIGMLGNKAGELDGIQAFKKSMKEKEAKSKPTPRLKDVSSMSSPPATNPGSPENQLDEIQQFKLLMKREAENRTKEGSGPDGAAPGVTSEGPISSSDAVTTKQVAAPAPILKTDNVVDSAIISAVPSHPVSVLNADDHPSGTISLLSLLGQTQPPVSQTLVADSSKTSTGSPDRKISSGFLGTQGAPGSGKSAAEIPINPPALHNPPAGSRLLAFGSRSTSNQLTKSHSPNPSLSSPHNNHDSLPTNGPTDIPGNSASSHQGPPRQEFTRGPANFSPFEGSVPPPALNNALDSAILHASDPLSRRPASLAENGPLSEQHGVSSDTLTNVALASSKGSRFAKFFDGKGKDSVQQKLSGMTHMGAAPVPTPASHMQDLGGLNTTSSEHRAMDDIFAMLSNSVQNHRMNNVSQQPPSVNIVGGGPNNQQQHNLHILHHQHQLALHAQTPSIHPNGRLEPLYDSRLDDRNFMPNEMVPGLRNAPPPRAREGGLFPDVDDPVRYAPTHRLPTQQRGPDQGYPGQAPIFAQQPNRNAGIPLQPHYRGGPSPILSAPNTIQNPAQRLPPGLANLGGRPPHEPSQFVHLNNLQGSGLLLGAVHANGPQQPAFNNPPPVNSVAFGGGMRGPLAPQMQNAHNALPVPGMSHPNNLDMRLQNQSQLMGLGGPGMRLGNTGFNPPPGQGGLMPHMMGMRPPQQQQPPLQQHIIPSHGMGQSLPAHLHNQGLPSNAQPAHDLMALLMGGQRE